MSTNALPWYKEPTRGQWLAFGAAWFGWVLDAFDFSIFLLAMPRISADLGTTVIGTTASLALTLLARLAGGVLAGAAADRWGRKLPLMLSIAWFAVCDGAIAYAPSFGWVLVLRTLFGFGMGAEWASGTALAMESWPERSRGIASGVLQGSWAIGFFLASWAYGLVVPAWGWRPLFVIAAVPALLVLPIRIWVRESDAWERAHGALQEATRRVLADGEATLRTIVWGCAAMALGFGAYYALVGVYSTMLVQELKMDDDGVARIGMLCQAGMLVGSIMFGALAGRRGHVVGIVTPALLALPLLPLYVGASPALLGVGAFATGMFGMGFCGVTPLLLTSLFPAVSRARNIGLVYHVGLAFTAFVPFAIASIAKNTGMSLGHTLALVAAVFLLGLTALMVFASERKPRSLSHGVAFATVGVFALGLPLLGCGGTDEVREDVAQNRAALSSLEEVTSFGANPAGLKMYRYVSKSAHSNAPLVVALHGCTQTAADYAKVGWNELGDQLGFHVVYPEQSTSNNPMHCFNWMGQNGNTANLHRGQGENESIKEMVDKMKADLSIDPKRVFVTGLSAGGAQTAIMLATWPDVFAAGAPIAGLPYDCAESIVDSTTCMNPGKTLTAAQWADKARAADPAYTGPWPRVSVWQGTSDAVVSPTNEKQIALQWVGLHGVSDTAGTSSASPNSSSGATRTQWKDASGAVVVEMYAVNGMGHGVPVDPASGCGTAGAFVLDEKICSAKQIAEFFGLTSPASAPDSTGGPSASSGSGSPTPSANGAGASSGCSSSRGGATDATASLFVALAALGVRARRVRAGRS